jgi:hypothetical protein
MARLFKAKEKRPKTHLVAVAMAWYVGERAAGQVQVTFGGQASTELTTYLPTLPTFLTTTYQRYLPYRIRVHTPAVEVATTT